MPVPSGHFDQILLNTNTYQLVPGSYKVEDISKMPPPVREGFPTYDQLSKESAVAWDDWSGGYGQIEYGSYVVADRQFYAGQSPREFKTGDRFDYSVDCDTRIARQITLAPKRNQTNANWTPILLKQCAPTDGVVALSDRGGTWGAHTRTGAATWTNPADLGFAPTDIIAWGDGSNTLYLIGFGAAAPYRYATSYANLQTGTFTTSTLGGNSQIAQFWTTGPAGTGGSGGTLWKAVLPNLVYATSNPKNGGAWTTAYTVGSSATNITGIVEFDNGLYVGKPEGLFKIAPDGTVSPVIDMSGAVDANNCSKMCSWGGYLFVPWVQGLYQYKGGSLLNVNDALASWRGIGPEVNTSNANPVRGRVVAMCASPTYLYIVVKNEAGEYYMLAYNGDTTPGRGWHPIANLGTNACTTIAWETVQTNPCLFLGYGATVDYLIMPRSGDNLLLDSNCPYQADGAIQFSEYESPLRGVQKSWLYLTVNIENLVPGSVYCDLAYAIDDAAVATTLARVDTPGWTTLFFPTTAQGRRMVIQVYLHGSGTATPRVRTVELHFQLRPARRKMWHFQVITGGGAAAPIRTNPTQAGATVVNNLIAARDSVIPVAFEDRFGVAWDAFVEEVTEAETEKLPDVTEPQEVVQVSVLEFKNGAGRAYVGDPLAIVGLAYAS